MGAVEIAAFKFMSYALVAGIGIGVLILAVFIIGQLIGHFGKGEKK